MAYRVLTCLFGLFVWFGCGVSDSFARPLLNLTEAERAFIASHPVLRVSNEEDYPPLDFAVSGKAQGFSIDLLDILAERAGLRFEYVNGHTWAELEAMFYKGELDLLHTVSKTPERENKALFTQPFYQYRMHFIVPEGSQDLSFVEDLVGKTLVTSEGWAPHTYLSRNYPELELLLVDNYEQQLDAVASGRADVMLSGAEVFHYTTQKMGLKGLRVSGVFREMDRKSERMFHMLVPKKFPELRDILNKALASVDADTLASLKSKWFGEALLRPFAVTMDAKERDYLMRSPVLRVGVERHFAPFAFSRSGPPRGYSVDMLSMLAKRVGLHLQFVHAETEQELQQLFHEKKVDILIAPPKGNEGIVGALSTKSYFRYNLHFVMRNGSRPISWTSELDGKTAVTSPGWMYHKHLLSHHPNIPILLVDDFEQQLNAVASGEADFMVATPEAFQHMNRVSGPSRLQLHPLPSDMDIAEMQKLKFWLQGDAAVLRSILDQAMETVTPGDISRLRRKWFEYPEIAELKVPLSLAEQAFIDSHPVVYLGGGERLDPFVQRNPDGTVSGHDIELTRMIAERTGLKLEFVVAPLKDVKAMGRKREVDGLMTAVDHERYRDIYVKSLPYHSFMSFVFVKRGNRDKFRGIKDLRGKRIAVQRGSALFDKVLAPLVENPKLVFVDSPHEMLGAVVSGQADYTVLDETAYSIAGQVGLRGMIEDAFPIGEQQDLYFQLRKDWPELVSIFNKGLRSISTQERNALRNHWFSADEAKAGETLLLTEVERRYLRRKGPLKACIGVNWVPFSILEPKRDHSGMAADYLRLFFSRMGSSYEVKRSQTWTATLDAMRNRECDFTPMVKFTKSRAEYMDFTTPYASFPYVIVTRQGEPLLRDIQAQSDQAFAVLRGYAVHEDLGNQYPDIRLRPVDTLLEGLTLVQSGEVYGYVGASAPIVIAMRQFGITDLKISGKLPYGYSLSVGTRNDEPILRGIFQKAVESLSPEDQRRIQDRWLAIKVEKVTDYTLLILVIGGATVVILLIVYWNRKLRIARKGTEQVLADLHKAQTLLEEQNATLERLSVTDPLTQLFNRSRLDKVLDVEILRARRQQQDLGVILLDVDYFKAINDTYGHKSGDSVLVQFAEILRTNVRATDVVGRWGGEEFLIICIGTDLVGAEALAEKLRERVSENTFTIDDKVTASFGVSAFLDGDTSDSLLERADRALYQAKSVGRNCVCAL